MTMNMNTFKKLTVAALLFTTPAGAATLSISGGTPYALPGGFAGPGGPGHFSGVFNPGDVVQRNGALVLDGPARVTFERVGTSEAQYDNWFVVDGVDVFSNHEPQPSAFTTTLDGGVLPIAFKTVAPWPVGTFANGQTSGFHGMIAWLLESPTTAYGCFNDSAVINKDCDDLLIRVSSSTIPLPAALWFMLSGIGLLLGVRRASL